MSEQLQRWSDNWDSNVRILEQASINLQGKETVPAGGTPEERLRILGELLEKLNLPVGNTLNPAASRAAEVRYALEQGARQLEVLIRALGANLDWAIGRALQDLRGDDPARGFVLTQDFARTGTGTFYNSDPLAFGFRNSLRPDHWLLEEFKAEDCYQFDGEPVIVLGLPSTAADARGRLLRSWYLTAVAKDFTQRIARRQKADCEKRRQEEQEQVRLAQERWSVSQAGKEQVRRKEAERLQARIAELERKLAQVETPSVSVNGEAVSR